MYIQPIFISFFLNSSSDLFQKAQFQILFCKNVLRITNREKKLIAKNCTYKALIYLVQRLLMLRSCMYITI